MSQIASYVKNTEFWCDRCDGVKVHSDKPETGTFFCQFGHGWKSRTQETEGNVTDDYLQVIYAVCTTCLKKPDIDVLQTISDVLKPVIDVLQPMTPAQAVALQTWLDSLP